MARFYKLSGPDLREFIVQISTEPKIRVIPADKRPKLNKYDSTSNDELRQPYKRKNIGSKKKILAHSRSLTQMERKQHKLASTDFKYTYDITTHLLSNFERYLNLCVGKSIGELKHSRNRL